MPEIQKDVNEPVEEIVVDPAIAAFETQIAESQAKIGEQQAMIDQQSKEMTNNQAMIGKQSQEIGGLRNELNAKPAIPQGPSEQEQIDTILKDIDTGEIDLKDGLSQVLEINTNLTASKVMSQFEKVREQDQVDQTTSEFHKDNADFQELLDGGSLQPYLDNDPMADEYTAYRQFKSDEKVTALQAKHAEELAVAKEEGAKLAEGAKVTTDVLGKPGTAARDAAKKPVVFKNNREASNAMLTQLKGLRSG